MKPLVVGTRGSRLALYQADLVSRLVTAANPGVAVRQEIVKTVGDKVLDVALSKIGDKGLFTKELEAALLEGRVDVAVHSLKDVPTLEPEELRLGAILEREDPRDVLISARGAFGELPPAPGLGPRPCAVGRNSWRPATI